MNNDKFQNNKFVANLARSNAFLYKLALIGNIVPLESDTLPVVTYGQDAPDPIEAIAEIRQTEPELDLNAVIDKASASITGAEMTAINQCVTDLLAEEQNPTALNSLSALCAGTDLPFDADFIIAGPSHWLHICKKLGDEPSSDEQLETAGFANVIYGGAVVVLENIPDHVAYYLRTKDFKLQVKKEKLGLKRQFTGNLTCDHPELNAMGVFGKGDAS